MKWARTRYIQYLFIIMIALLLSCGEDEIEILPILVKGSPIGNLGGNNGSNTQPNGIYNYSNQPVPDYIFKDNTESNKITDEGAALGRVLFYDPNLSVDNTVSCGNCHKQEMAFGDAGIVSKGVDGLTGRHTMRLVNARFSAEKKFFWDKRAQNLESQTTQPIQDHIEMGFSGKHGDPGMDDLILKLENISYYDGLFTSAFGDETINEDRMQEALSQFIRSIQSFDSRYDEGRARVISNEMIFSNFTLLENEGKKLYLEPPSFNVSGERIGGGLRCNGCHRAPEFDIDPNSNNNGVTGVFAQVGARDFTVTRAPSLRDLFTPQGKLNGPMMHDGSLRSIEDVIEHYNNIPFLEGNTGLDHRLRPLGVTQRLKVTDHEKNALIAFLKTLSGNNIYTDKRWSDPFQ